MPTTRFSRAARRLVTERCLIAADIDKTVLAQGNENERQHFMEDMAPELLRAAALGTHLAFLTGNSMHELCSRFLKWLIEHLCHTKHLRLLDRFHFFCNSGGVYAHFSLQDPELASQLFGPNADELFGVLTQPVYGGGKLAIRPRFIDVGYIESCSVPQDDADKIQAVLEKAAQDYVHELKARRDSFERRYDLAQVCDDNGELKTPSPDLRIVQYGGKELKETSVQISLKPVLSFRHAHKHTRSRLVGRDLRVNLTQTIQKELDRQGLSHYVARPGGRSTIDVTPEKLDKAYALEFLIDRLNLRGLVRYGQKFGYNTIYFGDEVIVGEGNDYPVTRIPGLLVFAVSSDKDLIPFLSHVFVPSTILDGPDAVADVLSHFNRCASTLLNSFDQPAKGQKQSVTQTALEALKEEIFVTRIREKIADPKYTDHLSVEDWQVLHAFVTIMCRNDLAARQWLSVLIGDLNAIMTQLSATRTPIQPALGTSHPDWRSNQVR